MHIYQTDTFAVNQLPHLADLVITSPSLVTLIESAAELFAWVDRHVTPDGFFVLDTPCGYGAHTLTLWEAERSTTWHQVAGRLFEDMYIRGDTQYLQVYCRHRAEKAWGLLPDSPRMSELAYNRCYEREMSHRCEFDSLLIGQLIEKFTKIGDCVLDPFCGTGTVPKVAERLGRIGIGIDRRNNE